MYLFIIYIFFKLQFTDNYSKLIFCNKNLFPPIHLLVELQLFAPFTPIWRNFVPLLKLASTGPPLSVYEENVLYFFPFRI
jgi:hypothetical protein